MRENTAFYEESFFGVDTISKLFTSILFSGKPVRDRRIGNFAKVF